MTDLVYVPGGNLMPALSIQEVAERRNAVVEFTRAAMHEGIDFGIIPNTTKPTLLKPGAEKLCTLFGLAPTFETLDSVKDWTGAEHGGEPLFYFEYKCKLYKNGVLIADGDGSCNSWEKKYRYREAKRLCPDCGQPTIIKGRREFGGGWLCLQPDTPFSMQILYGVQLVRRNQATRSSPSTSSPPGSTSHGSSARR